MTVYYAAAAAFSLATFFTYLAVNKQHSNEATDPYNCQSTASRKVSASYDNQAINDHLWKVAMQRLQAFVDFPNEVQFKDLHKESFVYYGDQSRFHYSFVSKVLGKLVVRNANQTFRVATMGGSNSVPYIPFVKNAKGYHQLLCKWLNVSLEPIGIDIADSDIAIGATNSSYFRKCFPDLIDIQPYDLLFIEFAMNDKCEDEAFEQCRVKDLPGLIERVIKMNPRIQIVVITVADPRWYRGKFPGKCDKCELVDKVYRQVAERYQVVVLRFHHLFCDSQYMKRLGFETNGTEAMDFVESFIGRDGIHGSTKLHILITELIVNYIKRSIQEFINSQPGRLSEIHDKAERSTNLISVKPTKSDAAYECHVMVVNETMGNLHISANFDATNGSADLKRNLHLYFAAFQNYGDFVEFNYTNFDGNIPRSICGNRGFRPYLSLFGNVPITASVETIDVNALFKFDQGLNISAKYKLDYQCTLYQPNRVLFPLPVLENKTKPLTLDEATHLLFPEKHFCVPHAPTVEELDVKMILREYNSTYRYGGLVLEHRCCQ